LEIAGAIAGYLVEALCYKPEGHGFDPDEVNEFFN
jgi:hypothetical protein